MTTTRIQQLFVNSKAFVAYLTAGDGGIKFTLDAALALIDGGINMLEIGIPFSDPIADGPIIQRASARALNAGTKLKDILWLIHQIRKHSDIPLILFSYYNPILSSLNTDFLQKAKIAGVDGLLIVDCPLEESQFIRQQCNQHNLDIIYIITTNTAINRIQLINNYAQGCLYYACRKGTTGVHNQLPLNLREKIQVIKSIVNLPVIVGFGITNKNMVSEILQYSDGVVIGSRLIQELENGISLSALSKLVQSIYSAK